MPVKIHGKDYITVAERVQSAHKLEKLGIFTEVLFTEPNVVIKAIVTTDKGVFTGISSANPSKAIEKTNPYEVAETSAVGRALAFAGYESIDSIASAEEMKKAGVKPDPKYKSPATAPATPINKVTIKQLGMLGGIANKELGWSNIKLTAVATKLFGVKMLTELNSTQASRLITQLQDQVKKEEAMGDEIDLSDLDGMVE